MIELNQYNICSTADIDIFNRQCSALEKAIPDLKKLEQAEDVDGSLMQRYDLNKQKITVFLDCYVDAVYIKSETPLEPYFNKPKAGKRCL